MKLQEINNYVQEFEKNYQRGESDLTETTSMIEEVLKNYTEDDRVIPMKLYQVKAEDPARLFSSGIAPLDAIVGKFRKGDIFTLTAASGTGKSTFARELLIRFSAQGKKCLFFSYEDSNDGLIEKLGNDVPDGYIPNVLNDKSLVWIEARILEAIVKFNVEIVFIDNLKAITDFTARNVNNSIEFTMQKLKQIALKYGVMIFLCAHIRKDDGKAIDLNSVKDSTAIADISSLVIALKRLPFKNSNEENRELYGEKMGNLTRVSIIKNRNNGVCDNFLLMFRPNGISGRYDENISKDDVEPYQKVVGKIISTEEINDLLK